MAPESEDRLEIRPLYRAPQLENLAVDSAEGKLNPYPIEIGTSIGPS